MSWLELARVYTRPRVIAMMFLGFSGGLPFLLVFSTLTAWLSDEGVSKSAIGFFAWVGITYSIKVVWAPVVDRLAIPFLTHRLGQRRSWMLLGQIGIAVGLLLMSFIGTADLYLLSMAALVVAFSSATQDISIDAYRIEAQDEKYQGAMSATYIFGYRVALLAAGAGALYMASFYNWVIAYQAMALLTLVGIVTVLLIAEPVRERDSLLAEAEPEGQSWARGVFNSVINPFVDFFTRNSGFALFILLFIAVFRLSDIAMGIMANPFYLDMGYTKIEIANVAKVFGFFMSIAGAAICGLLVVKWGIYRCLLVGAIAVASTNILFAGLSLLPAEMSYLAVVISADNISGGFAATAFVAYLSSLTNRAYTATQYALFSSLMTLPGKFLSGFSGLVVDGYGYFEFFLIAAALGIPAILMVIVMMRRQA
ncbi:MAG: PAT family beta-lactamase induction signal transducer AmpG [Candidatus Azotimanducaceae bacterium]|jgi:PAT family beta-lactamase induction signal transducer AmpG